MPQNNLGRFIRFLLIAGFVAPMLAWAAQEPAQQEKSEKPADPPPLKAEELSKDASAPKAKGPTLPVTEAEKLLDVAIKKFASIKSVSADIVQKVDMLNQAFELKGQYVRADENHFRLELELSGLGNTKGKMIQVADGKVIWDEQLVTEVSTGKELAHSYRKRDMAPLLEKLNDPEFDPEAREQIMPRLGLAGPEVALLANLRHDVRFETMPEESTFEDKPVWIFRGFWTERSRLALNTIPGAKAESPLPDYVPSVVALWVDRETGWPYQIRLSGRKRTAIEMEQAETEANTGADGRPTGSKASAA